MQYGTLGPLGRVSRLTLGGGGIGHVWGPSAAEEAIASLRLAVDNGIDLIDTAPSYGDCEEMVARAFEGRLPEGVRITTKHGLGTPPEGEVFTRLRESLEASLKAMRLERIDLMVLHSRICPDGFVFPQENERRAEFATEFSFYRDAVIPAFERLVADGKLGAWGITAIDLPDAAITALELPQKPAAAQVLANLLDSGGEMNNAGVRPRPREVMAAARANGVGVMGVRAVQAGALTSGFDRERVHALDRADFDRAASFRELCRQWGEDPSIIAHRYALGIDGVDTLVLGIKDTGELRQALAAEAAGPLAPEEIAQIEALGLRREPA